MPPSASRPTLVTVARLAGVSVASASRVLSGGTATPEMEQRVREAAAQLGYVPDTAARSLRARRTNQLALAVPDVGNPTYVELMRGIESITRTSGYRLLVQSTGADSADEVSLIESLGRRYVDGLIIVPIRITNELLRALAAATAPITVVTSLPEGSLVDNVRTDSGLGVTMVIEHMRTAGRRSFAMLNGPVDTVPGAERIRGFEAAMATAGLRPVAVECAEDFTYAAGLTAARRLFGGCRPDGVMCGNDLLAFAAIRALRERGLDVPRDVAVAGIDDTDLAEMHMPSLTSVSLESAARGKLAARMLLDRIANPDLPPRKERVLPRLVIRESA
ncbi:MAG TPA: LacI family DNA-binding transcriptional regulator [Streptosporangiaceae bacterium]